CEARDGSIWAVANSQQLIRFDRDGTWHREERPLSTRVTGIFIDASNTLWVAQGGFLYRRSLDQRSYMPVKFATGDVDSHLRRNAPSWHNEISCLGERPGYREITARPAG